MAIAGDIRINLAVGYNGDNPFESSSLSGRLGLNKGPFLFAGFSDIFLLQNQPSTLYDFIPTAEVFGIFSGVSFPLTSHFEINGLAGFNTNTSESDRHNPNGWYAGGSLLLNLPHPENDLGIISPFIQCETSLNELTPSCQIGLALTGKPSKPKNQTE